MKTEKEIEKLFERVDEKKESLLVLHVDENDNFGAHVCGDFAELAAGIATIVFDGMKKNAESGEEKLACAIIEGVSQAMQIPSMSAIKLMMMLTKSIIDSRKELGKDLAQTLGVDLDDDGDKDDDEDCKNCENNRWCQLPSAIKYRKENHIPAPKNRKNEKKRCDNKH